MGFLTSLTQMFTLDVFVVIVWVINDIIVMVLTQVKMCKYKGIHHNPFCSYSIYSGDSNKDVRYSDPHCILIFFC